MAKDEKLTIHKLVFDLQVSDKNAYKHFADRISRLCNQLLPAKLKSVLQRHQIPEGTLVIHKLEIKLGAIQPHRFEKTIVDAIVEQFGYFLSRKLPEIEREIKQAKFKFSEGRQFSINNSTFSFESDLFLNKSISLDREVKSRNLERIDLDRRLSKSSAIVPADEVFLFDMISKAKKYAESKTTEKVDLPRKMMEQATVDQNGKGVEKIDTVHDERSYDTPNIDIKQKSLEAKDHTKQEIPEEAVPEKKPKGKSLSLIEQIQQLRKIPTDLPPKAVSDLERVFLYYIRYGRLPSNIKFELGMKMLDIFNINQKDIRFFNELDKHIKKNDKAKERLIRLTDDKNKQSLVRKDLFKPKEIQNFDPKIPKSFEDYFTAIVLERSLSEFSAELRRYTLNDMVQFFYADHPQKLRSIIQFLLLEADQSGDLHSRIEKLFSKLGKATIVKILASFVRKAGYVNKSLNQLNKKQGKSVKAAHSSVLYAFLRKSDPIAQLRDDGFEIDGDLVIAPRVFLQKPPEFQFVELSNAEVVNYFFTFGTLPHSSLSSVPSIDRLSIIIMMLGASEIKNMPYFKNRLYEQELKYSSVGQLSQQAIEHLIKILAPDIATDVLTKFQYFATHIQSGVPETFQKAFVLYYVLRNKSVSYLEEMINYWKKEFGDADQIIKKRWKVSEDLQSELNKMLYIKEVSIEEQIKVDYEFQSYSQDISVKNAGLVILWPFLKIYFNMLDLLDEKGDFRSLKERERACHLLQYLAIKKSEGEELYYPLNKILTGYPLDEPLSYDIKMTEKEIDVSNALLNNVIKQWNALKGSSVDALRGSFFIRDGVLAPSPNGWLLTVEKKTYDILLDKLPWGIGMIKLSWAPYVISVEWERNIM